MKHKLFIIGSPSLDILTIKGQLYQSPGGAGLYTALGAIHVGVRITLFAPKPTTIPSELSFISHIMEWIGPPISADQLPRFEIVQSENKTDYKKAFFGAEEELKADDLPNDLSHYDLVHIVPLGNAKQQLSFIEACKIRGAKYISTGTALPIIASDPNRVLDVKDESDIFFMNHIENDLLKKYNKNAATLSGKLVFMTQGENGATVNQGNHETSVSSPDTKIVDPTGAGDTFCGATLAHIAQGKHPVMAAKSGANLAAFMIEGIGPEKLISKEKHICSNLKPRVVINQEQLHKIAHLISDLPEAEAFPFIDSSLPPKEHPLTIDYFFVTTLQQFSFWSHKNGQYHKPLIHTIGGDELKGAFYLFQAYTKRLEKDPEFFTPKRQATQSLDDMKDLFRADNGKDVMPATQLHLDFAHTYGLSMLELGWTPSYVVNQALSSKYPLKTFLEMLDKVGGYREDPLRKKSALLALILEQRPEKLFHFGKNETLPPVVDYHCMRGSLRLGLVDILDKELDTKIKNRQLVSPEDEWDIRHAIYEAVDLLPELSGRSMGAVDWFFFMSRKRCPEMTDPDCSSCGADPICAHRKDYFQPVIRTSFY